eukprot:GHVU01147668.1.p1 GENE.GHVU01147668.1~~GHVU01147668.1.p1  ORF type:complete len:507 (-),score=76.18 GHVU01147668.1:1050-2570(-)
MRSRCSLIAAASARSKVGAVGVPVEVAVPPPLLSRFDLIVVMTDDTAEDDQRCDFVLQLCGLAAQHNDGNDGSDGSRRAPGEGPTPSSVERLRSVFAAPSSPSSSTMVGPLTGKDGGAVSGREEGGGGGWMSSRLRSVVALLRTKSVVFGMEAREVLSAYYTVCRRDVLDRGLGGFTVTVRTLEGLIRLSAAHAKLMNRPRVELRDAVSVVLLFEACAGGRGVASSLGPRESKGQWGGGGAEGGTHSGVFSGRCNDHSLYPAWREKMKELTSLRFNIGSDEEYEEWEKIVLQILQLRKADLLKRREEHFQASLARIPEDPQWGNGEGAGEAMRGGRGCATRVQLSRGEDELGMRTPGKTAVPSAGARQHQGDAARNDSAEAFSVPQSLLTPGRFSSADTAAVPGGGSGAAQHLLRGSKKRTREPSAISTDVGSADKTPYARGGGSVSPTTAATHFAPPPPLDAAGDAEDDSSLQYVFLGGVATDKSDGKDNGESSKDLLDGLDDII